MESEPLTPKNEASKEIPVFLYDEKYNLYAPLTDPRGPLTVVEEEIPQINNESVLIKSGRSFFTIVKPFSGMRGLSKRAAEIDFKDKFGIHPDNTVIVRRVLEEPIDKEGFTVYRLFNP